MKCSWWWAIALLLVVTTTAAPAQREIYYDQLDTAGHVKGFWNGPGAGATCDPAATIPPTAGSIAIEQGDEYVSRVATGNIATICPTNEYKLYARIRMSEFEDEAGAERNAEIAFRTDGERGYLVTLDGGNDLIRLRRQGGSFDDLVPPVPLAIHPGDVFHVSVTVRGRESVDLAVVVSKNPDFTAPVFRGRARDTEWLPTGSRIDFIGFTDRSPFRFDLDYFAIGEPGYPHGQDSWLRPGHTTGVTLPSENPRPPAPPSEVRGATNTSRPLGSR
jgi:hypothetical protein